MVLEARKPEKASAQPWTRGGCGPRKNRGEGHKKEGKQVLVMENEEEEDLDMIST